MTTSFLGVEKMTDHANLLKITALFEDAFNRHAIDEVMSMFVEDAVMEIEGVTRLDGKDAIRMMLEYDDGVNSHLQLVNRRVIANTVTCQIIETNDRISVAGLDVLLYSLCELSCKSGLIHTWCSIPEAHSTQVFAQYWDIVKSWISANHPADYPQLFAQDDQFIRNRENGRRMVQLAKRYNSAVAP
jgi:hypothetical protein